MVGSDGVPGAEGMGGSEATGGNAAGGGKSGVPPSTGEVPVGLLLPIVVAGCEKFDGPVLFSDGAFAWSGFPEPVSFRAY